VTYFVGKSYQKQVIGTEITCKKTYMAGSKQIAVRTLTGSTNTYGTSRNQCNRFFHHLSSLICNSMHAHVSPAPTITTAMLSPGFISSQCILKTEGAPQQA